MLDEIKRFNRLETPPKGFFNIPDCVYVQSPHYIPEDYHTIKDHFNIANDFFDNGDIIGTFIDEKVRLVGFVHPSYGEDVAYFGYWEGINDLSVNKYLFEQIEKWAVQKGIKHIYGPINFTTAAEYRLQLSDFGAIPSSREPCNPDYYPKLLNEMGYQQKHHYSSVYTKVDKALSKQTLSVHERFKKNIDIQPLSRSVWKNEIQSFYNLIQKSFIQNTCFTPMSYNYFHKTVGHSFAQQLCPKSSMYSRDENGNITGMILVFPHYGELCTQSSDMPIALTELDYEKHFSLLKESQAIIKVIAIDPKYRTGRLYSLLLTEAVKAIQKHYSHSLFEISILSEKTKQLMFKSKIYAEKHYGLFHKELT